MTFNSWQELVSNLEDAVFWGCRDLSLEPIDQPSDLKLGFRDRKSGESWMIGLRELKGSLAQEPAHMLKLMGTREGREIVATLMESGSDQIREYVLQGGRIP